MAHLVTNLPSVCIQFSCGGEEAPQNLDTMQFWNSFQLLQWPHMLAAEFWVLVAVIKPNPHKYRVIHKYLRNFRIRVCNNPERHSRKEHINRYRISPSFFFVLGAVVYLQVSPLGGSCETWRGQGIRKRSVSWNLPKLSQLWRYNGGFGPCTTQNHLQTKQFMSGHEIPAEWMPVRYKTNRPAGAVGWDCRVFARDVCQVLDVSPRVDILSTCKVGQKLGVSSVDMLPFGMTIPSTVPQRSEIPEGLMNYPV
jgi:hypothetical protein